MKKLVYILFASVITLTGCSEDFELNDNVQDLTVEFLPGKYVAFNAPGANVTLAAEDVDEDGDPIDLEVEIPTGTTSDVTVNYTFGGTAIFGTDFTVTGATSAGGSVVIVPDPGDDAANLIDHVDLTVEVFTDAVVDGDKTLTITLVSASSAEGEILIGRGGTDILRTAVINIADIDAVVTK